jgi:hypothetical protein
VLLGLTAEEVVTYTRYKHHFTAQSGSSDCLVGTLSSGIHEELSAEYGLAKTWDAGRLHHHVCI